ncbi:hypothetical protein HK405_004704 [Cladochytrium tenue]|nr:hypothetical protein HK405_004704 [Cladochytrium tenue]
MLVNEQQGGAKHSGAGFLFMAGPNHILMKASSVTGIDNHLPRASNIRFATAMKKLSKEGHGAATRAQETGLVIDGCTKEPHKPQTVLIYCKNLAGAATEGCPAQLAALRQHVILAVPKDCAGGYFVRIQSVSEVPHSDSAYKVRAPLGAIKRAVIDTNWSTPAEPAALRPQRGAQMGAGVQENRGHRAAGAPGKLTAKGDGKHTVPPAQAKNGGKVKRDNVVTDHGMVSFLIEDSNVPEFADEQLDIKELTKPVFDTPLTRKPKAPPPSHLPPKITPSRPGGGTSSRLVSLDPTKEFSFGPSFDVLLVSGHETCKINRVNVDAMLDVRLKGHAIVPGGDAELKLVVDARLSLSYDEDVTLFSVPTAGYNVPGIFEAGLGMTVTGRLNAEFALAGHLETGVRIEFPKINLVYGQGSPVTSAESAKDPGDLGTPVPFVDATFDIFGMAEVHIIPRAFLTLNIFRGVVKGEVGAVADASIGMELSSRGQAGASTKGSSSSLAFDFDIYARCVVNLYAAGQLWKQTAAFNYPIYDSNRIALYSTNKFFDGNNFNATDSDKSILGAIEGALNKIGDAAREATAPAKLVAGLKSGAKVGPKKAASEIRNGAIASDANAGVKGVVLAKSGSKISSHLPIRALASAVGPNRSAPKRNASPSTRMRKSNTPPIHATHFAYPILIQFAAKKSQSSNGQHSPIKGASPVATPQHPETGIQHRVKVRRELERRGANDPLIRLPPLICPTESKGCRGDDIFGET